MREESGGRDSVSEAIRRIKSEMTEKIERRVEREERKKKWREEWREEKKIKVERRRLK